MAVRTVKVTLEANTVGFVAGMASARKATAELGAEMDVLAVKHSGSFNKLTNVTAGVGVALVGAFALAEKAAYGFDKQMSAVDAVLDHAGQTAGQSAAQIGGLRDAAIKAGQDTAFTATQAAQAEEELAKAGISAADILSGGLTGALSLASAGSLDLADAAKYASQAMIEFNLHGKDMAHIADVLTAGANKSVTDVQGLGDALGQTGTVAHQAGMSLDETVGVLALFSQHGLDGVEAGTTFKQMLLKLEGPSNKAAGEMKQLGLNVYDANGNFVSAAQLADNLQKSLGGLTEQQRNYALSTIFGSRAVRGAIDLYNAGKQGVDDWTAAVNDSGVAQQTANIKLNNLAGDVKKLEGSLQALAITSSGGATSGMRVLAQGAEGAVNWFGKLPTGLQSTVSIMLALSGASLLAAAGFLKVRGTIKQMNDALVSSGPSGEKFAGFLGKAGKFTAIGTAVLVATGFMVEGLNSLAKWADSREQPTQYKIDDLTASLATLAETGKQVGAVAKITNGDLAAWSATFAKFVSTNLFATTADQAKYVNTLNSQLTQLDQGLAAMVAGGNTLQAKTDFDLLTQSLQNAGLPLDYITNLFPQYRAAATGASQATTGVTKGFADVKEQTSLMAGGLQDAIDKLSTIDAIFKSLNGAQIGVTEANIAYQQAMRDMDKALKTNKHSLDIHKQAGDDDVTAILATIKAAEAAAQAKFDESGSVDKASAVWTSYIATLRKNLLAQGLTKKQVDELLAAYAKMPPLISTTVTTPGMDTALSNAHTLMSYYSKLNGKTVKTTVLTHYGTSTILGTGQQFNRWGGLYEHAAVGVLREAHVAPAVGRGARYAYAEPSTGGEAFVPKEGNYGRSMSILHAAAGWYNASVVPNRREIHLHVTSEPGAARALVGQLKFTITELGGVTKAFGP